MGRSLFKDCVHEIYVSVLNLQLFQVNHAGYLIRCSGKAYKLKGEMKT